MSAIAESFATFAAERRDLVRTLTALPSEPWSRKATIRHGKKLKEETLLDRLTAMTTHEQTHCEQLEELLR